MTETKEPYICEQDRIFRSYLYKNVCCCGKFFNFFSQVQRIHVRRCLEFGHVHRFQSNSFGHLHSVMLTFLDRLEQINYNLLLIG